MTFVLAFLFIAEWLGVIVVILLLGASGFIEMARANRSPRRFGTPGANSPSVGMTRWHVVAAACLIGSTLTFSYGLACNFGTSDGCSGAVSGLAPVLQFAFAEVFLWLITLPALFGPIYAVRLHRNGVRDAELFGLGLVVVPVSLFAFTQAFEPGIDAQMTFPFAIAGPVLYALGLALPWPRGKTSVLSISCVAMLLALSELIGPTNPVWLLAALVMGYTVFRAEWRLSVEASRATGEMPDHPVAGQDSGEKLKPDEWSTAMRIVTFFCVNLGCVAALWLFRIIGFSAEASTPAAVFALAALAIAACGALLMTLVPLTFGHTGRDVDAAGATFVAVLVAATVMILIAGPPVMADSYLGLDAGWKPVLGTFACLGASAIALTTLTGRERQIRPFMVAIVLPAVVLLPSDAFFTFLRDDSFLTWTQRLIETGIIVVMLAIMWYVYGPGRRRKSGQTEAATNPSPVELE